ncbi:hypothetical protein A5649_06855 [Mycolicibacter heraklionensis]|uniref:Uncharacterized protein n=1 Tax=Mycolicibacter heraklionensis TaxID=512402 RepID=A0AA91EZR3_9MYCO|nr:hypothetical protein [Mycolicibacter heraklionensis]OBK83204.1 hypothetical protein A5649_06855 [Mycolicibacter heraklionensis]
MAGVSALNRALNRVPRRAEGRVSAQLKDTFVDSGVAAALESIDHQVLYGRRGTGKTHALNYLAATRLDEGDIGIYIDLRIIGSAQGLFDSARASALDRTSRLLVNLLTEMHDVIMEAVLADDQLIADATIAKKLDYLLDSLKVSVVETAVETTTDVEKSKSRKGFLGFKLGSSLTASADAGGELTSSQKDRQSQKRTGEPRLSLNFGEIARSLRELATSLRARRVWLLLDEWSSVPLDMQPYLGEFLIRCVTPVQAFTVKIAAIEQQTNFRAVIGDGAPIGIELGADFAANINLDDFMVFEQDQKRAPEFFRGLFYKHLTAGAEAEEQVPGLHSERDFISIGFTNARVFDELVRASEGVPRDAINIAAKAAVRSGERAISMPEVRRAARQWFQTDKESALRAVPGGQELLNWVIDKVIREKRARGFLVNQRSAGAPLLTQLFDARVLHLVRKGYSAQDEPGERYDVYVIDYGAYVDLINTQNAPQGVLPVDLDAGDVDDSDGGWVEVPGQDLRALRRAILDIEEFLVANPQYR